MKLDYANPELDGTLDALADARRRAVLRVLSNQSDTVASVEDLIRHLHPQDRATTPAQLETELHHHYLPKLAEQGLIEYDIRSGQIRYRSDKTTEELLQFIRDL